MQETQNKSEKENTKPKQSKKKEHNWMTQIKFPDFKTFYKAKQSIQHGTGRRVGINIIGLDIRVEKSYLLWSLCLGESVDNLEIQRDRK